MHVRPRGVKAAAFAARLPVLPRLLERLRASCLSFSRSGFAWMLLKESGTVVNRPPAMPGTVARNSPVSMTSDACSLAVCLLK